MSGIFKRSFFWKIFLWFWLAIILLIGTLISVDILTNNISPTNHYKHIMGDVFRIFGTDVIRLYENKQTRDLDDLFARLHSSADMDVFLLDSNGTLLAGALKVLPQELGKPLHQAIVSGLIESDSNAPGRIAAVFPFGGKYLIGSIHSLHRPPFPFTELTWVSLYKFIFLILVSGMVCYALSRHFSAPIIELQQATRRFSRGETAVRISSAIAGRNDELGSLASDFNAMVERTENLMRLQRQLIGDISHELRSPLTRLVVSLELAKKAASADVQHPLARIEKEAGRLNEMIEQILSLSGIESGIEGFHPVQFDLSRLLREIGADAEYEGQNENKRVNVSAPAECFVYGVETLLRSSIENVVRNAVRYTTPNSAVDTRLESVERAGIQTALIIISDHGLGVPEADLKNIFLPFYRISGARDRKSGGTGLGLHITERAVRLHGGAVSALNNKDHQGLSVSIELPIRGKFDGMGNRLSSLLPAPNQ